jgi:hypothetical protein
MHYSIQIFTMYFGSANGLTDYLLEMYGVSNGGHLISNVVV